jgi:hypothetical protein
MSPNYLKEIQECRTRNQAAAECHKNQGPITKAQHSYQASHPKPSASQQKDNIDNGGDIHQMPQGRRKARALCVT